MPEANAAGKLDARRRPAGAAHGERGHQAAEDATTMAMTEGLQGRTKDRGAVPAASFLQPPVTNDGGRR